MNLYATDSPPVCAFSFLHNHHVIVVVIVVLMMMMVMDDGSMHMMVKKHLLYSLICRLDMCFVEYVPLMPLDCISVVYSLSL